MKEIVVYQMGKVASTSIVNFLNQVDGVRAYQSHFFGRAALSGILEGLLDPRISDYFHDHNIGQFNSNIVLTRRIEAHALGKVPGDTLAFLSLTREPIEWLRSSILQDFPGHVPNLLASLTEDEKNSLPENEGVRLALLRLIHRIATTYEALPKVCRATEIRRVLQDDESLIPFRSTRDREQFVFLYSIFLRPLTWFDQHFRPALEFDVASMEPMDRQAYRKDSGWSKCYVIRYEDLPRSMPLVLADLGIDTAWALPKENSSDGKEHGSLVKSVFESAAGKRLRKLVLQDIPSAYVDQFGYRTRGA